MGLRIDNEDYNVRGREVSQNIFRDEHSLTNTTFSLGYENQVSENFSFRTNLGSAWRTPNMAELYSYGSHGFKASFGLLRYYYNEDEKIYGFYKYGKPLNKFKDKRILDLFKKFRI